MWVHLCVYLLPLSIVIAFISDSSTKMILPNKNAPKFFFNFIGPESDDQDYMPITPETQLTLAVRASVAIEDTNKPAIPAYGKGPSKSTPKIENPNRAFGRWDLTRTDMLKRKLPILGRHKRVRSDPSLFALVDEVPVDKKQKNVEENQDPVAEGTQPSGSGSRGKKRGHEGTAMPERMEKLPDWLREIWEAKKKIIDEEKEKEKEKAVDSNGSKVIIKGVMKKDDDGRVTIVCMCHDRAHNADEFISHAGGEESVDQTRFVIVSGENP